MQPERTETPSGRIGLDHREAGRDQYHLPRGDAVQPGRVASDRVDGGDPVVMVDKFNGTL